MPTISGHTTAIRASDVIGMDLYDTSGEKIGKVEDVVLDKTTNRTMFAVVSIGGAVTTSDNCYPMPWSLLEYAEAKRGYVVPYTKDQLAKGPSESMSALTKNDGAGPRDAAYGHYKIARDW